MFLLIITTIALGIGLVLANAYGNYEEVKANWGKYKSNLMYLFAAPLFKPDDDPRSATQFAIDSFNEVVGDYIKTTMRIFLDPLFSIFRLFLNGADEMLGGILNMRSILARMWESWNGVTQIFFHRFAATLGAAQRTFLKLYEAMRRVYATAISSLYTGLSTIYAIMSSLDLLVNIAIAALIVIISMMFFFWFVLWPVIPIAIAAVAFISDTSSGGGVSGMGSVLSGCFAAGTFVALSDGRKITIEDLCIGDVLHGGATVTGTMVFENTTDDVFELDGIVVSGCHLVYGELYPISVKDHPRARRLTNFNEPVFCLITSNRRIPIVSPLNNIIQFGDWEELPDDLVAQTRWHNWVNFILNSDSSSQNPEPLHLGSQAAFSPATRVMIPGSTFVEIHTLLPGDYVLSGNIITRVTGIVCIAAEDVCAVTPLDLSGTAFASSGIWLRGDESLPWIKPAINSLLTAPSTIDMYYHLFTESGTFIVAIGNVTEPIEVRDFSDVGMRDLPKSYEWVLTLLRESRV